eukprot:TRINITY_DN2489_c1_g1_i1.p1 TRINITY_DN2489_c1_g1~~TRINITY_DN2489_c1_g1_i1.p1  ORF type:complete len:444 (-),score=112.32 TRINITY_DN2489_c1_g1_i1:176-1507(-)
MQQPKKPRILACLYCNKSHKKCDGQRPCSNCIANKIECSENSTRKAIGRPKKRNLDSFTQNTNLQTTIPPSINKSGMTFNTVTSLSFGQGNPTYLLQENKGNSVNKPFNFIEVKENQMCSICNSIQMDDAKFCSQCGNNLNNFTPKTTVDDLKKQIDILKQNNEFLQNTIKMKEKTSTQEYFGPQMWALFKFKTGQYRKQIPPPVYILKTSNAFQKLLGYDSLLNIYLPDLVPKQFHKIFDTDFTTHTKCMVDLPENALPKLNCNSRITYQHSDGHYIDVQVSTDIYFDPITRDPTFGMVVVENVFPHTSTIPNGDECLEQEHQKISGDCPYSTPTTLSHISKPLKEEIPPRDDDLEQPVDSTFEFEFISSDSPNDSKSFDNTMDNSNHSTHNNNDLDFFTDFDNVNDLLSSNNPPKDPFLVPSNEPFLTTSNDPLSFSGFDL